jgi:hypothetical protein
MKKRGKKIYAHLRQVISLLLVLLFLSISLLPAFHHHPKAAATEQSDDADALHVKENKCLICEYYAHHPGKEMYLSYPPAITIPLPKPIVLGMKVAARIYKFTLSGFSNKGPPLWPLQ